VSLVTRHLAQITAMNGRLRMPHPDRNYYGSCTLTSISDLENYTLISVPLSVHISITLQFAITNFTSVAGLKVF